MTHVPKITFSDGKSIPQLGLGVWQAANGQETKEAVLAALTVGYRHIDTAALYQNEASVGEAIRESNIPREEIFVTTKLWNSDQGTGNVRPALETSLKKLGLDYVDLYLIHWPAPANDLFIETWKEFELLHKEGLTKSIGVSNFRVEDLERLRSENLSTPVVNQIELHPGFIQKELREYGDKHAIRIESWSPIGGSRGTILNHEIVNEIAKNHSKSPAQIIIRWHLQHDLIVIPKSVHPERIKENFDVFNFTLSENEMQKIDAIGDGQRGGPDPATMNNH